MWIHDTAVVAQATWRASCRQAGSASVPRGRGYRAVEFGVGACDGSNVCAVGHERASAGCSATPQQRGAQIKRGVHLPRFQSVRHGLPPVSELVPLWRLARHVERHACHKKKEQQKGVKGVPCAPSSPPSSPPASPSFLLPDPRVGCGVPPPFPVCVFSTRLFVQCDRSLPSKFCVRKKRSFINQTQNGYLLPNAINHSFRAVFSFQTNQLRFDL